MTSPIFPVPCARWSRALAAASPDDLSPAEHEALAAHVAGCAACSAVQREYQAMDEHIFSLPSIAPLAHLPAPLRSLVESHEPDDEMGVYFVEGEEFISVQRFVPVAPPVFPARTAPHRRRLYTFALSVLLISLLTVGTLSVLPLRGLSLTTSSGSAAGGKVYQYAIANVALYDITLMGQLFSTNLDNGQSNWTMGIPQATGAIAVNNQMIYIGILHGVTALRLTDQLQLWNSPIAATVNASLQTDASGVYVGSSQGIYALRTDNGSQFWHFVQPDCGNCAGTIITVTAGNVYAFSKGLYALNTTTGQPVWHDDRFSSTNSHVVAANGKLYVASTVTNQLYILRADTGKQLNVLTGTNVVAADGLVYVSTQKNGVYALHTSDDSIQWDKPTLAINIVAAGNGVIYATSLTSFTYLSTPITTTAMATPSPASSPNFAGQQGPAIFYQLRIGDGSSNWESTLPITLDNSTQSLVVAGNLYVGTTAGLTALSVKDGSILWQNEANQAFSSLVAA